MAENISKLTGSLSSVKDDSSNAGIIPSAVIGIVKNNIDPAHTGKIEVYIVRGNSPDEDNPAYWVPVRYLSPFFGYTRNTASKDDTGGSYVGNPHSYGFWATPPDIDTEVLCVFLNGDPSKGFYIGCIPQAGMTQMVPAIGSSTSVDLNSGEAAGYGDAKKLPVTEFNNANEKNNNSPTFTNQTRPVHSYQAAILNNQGLIRDPDRGVISSSANRESPSNVFGISTPGRPVYKGGYDDTTIGDAIKNNSTPNENFKIIGRRGGHTLVMDDGDILGRDQLVRLRTGGGHMIMMNDASQVLTIIHANGQSYIELGKEGTIDMYSTNSVNIRTQGDLNLHADRNININAAKDLNISAENVKIESLKETTNYVGTDYRGYTKGNHTVRVESKMAFASIGDMGLKSRGTVYVNGGPDVKLNSGEISLTPEEVKQLSVKAHDDTLYDPKNGYLPAPGKLSSITSRAPAHMPWTSAGKGTDAKADLNAENNLPSSPTQAASIANSAATSLNPSSLTTTSLAATIPNISSVSDAIGPLASSSMVSQMAMTAAFGPFGPAALSGAGVLTSGQGIKTAAFGSLALNPKQMVTSGIFKNGSAELVERGIQQGKSISEAVPSNLFTGKYGINNMNQYLNSPQAQAQSGIDIMKDSGLGLKATGLITGNENSTQVAGLIMSAASVGMGPTMAYVNSLSAGAAAASSLAGLGTQLTNMTVGSPKDLIASGNYAAGLAEKNMSALSGVSLGGLNVTEKLKGAVAGAFSAISSAIKPLKAGPQNLATVKEAASLPTSSAAAGAFNNLTSLSGSSNIVAGLGALQTAFKGIAGSTGSEGVASAVQNLKDKLKGDSLTSLAGTGLSPGDAEKLASAINSVGSGGQVDVKLPTVAKDTFDFSAIKAQSKSLLGDDRVPPIPFGTESTVFKIPSADQVKKYDMLKAELDKNEDDYYATRKALYDAKAKYGDESSQAKAAEASYKTTVQKQEDLRNQIADLSKA
jgi:hypothetical protein